MVCIQLEKLRNSMGGGASNFAKFVELKNINVDLMVMICLEYNFTMNNSANIYIFFLLN